MPTPQNVHVDAVLTNVSIAFRNSGFVADQIFPQIGVKKESDLYYKYKRAQSLTLPNTKRAPKANYARVDWDVETDLYKCEEYGLEDLIDDRERDNADAPLNLDVDTTEFLTDLVLLDYEKRVIDIVTDPSVIEQTSALDAANRWDNYESSDSTPMEDVDSAKNAVRLATGTVPNIMVIGSDVLSALKFHPDIVERVKYVSGDSVTTQVLARLFELDRVIEAHAVYNAAREGQDEDVQHLWGAMALIAHVEPKPGIKKVSLGYTFATRQRQTERYREEKKRSDVIRVSEVKDERLVCAECGFLYTTVVG